MKEVTVSAKTLDEALTKGCLELGVGLDEVDFEVVDEGGVFRKMSVKISVKAADAGPAQPVPPADDTAAPAHAAAASDPAVVVKSGEVEEFEIGGQTRKPAREPLPVTPFDEHCPKFVQTREFVEKFCHLLDESLTVRTSHDDHEYVIAVDGENANIGRLIGKNGHTLSALNTIVSAIAHNTHTGESRRVVLDVANYREQRREFLVALAKRKAEQVKKTGKPLHLDPMPARERVIVHTTLQDVEGVTTQSEGVEPNRYLVIRPGAR